MSAVLKKEIADQMVFKHQPKAFHYEATKVAKDFVNLQGQESSGFQIAEVVAEQSGVEALRKQNIEAQIEETVLARLKEIEEQAYKKAYDLGFIEGSEKAFNVKNNELKESLSNLDHIYKIIDDIKTEMVRQNETELLSFTHKLATRIAMREIELNQQPVLEMIQNLTAEVQSAETVYVRLNPKDFHFIEELRKRNVKSAESLNRIKFIEEETITPGGCVVETDFGSIDGTVEQRIEKSWKILESKLPIVKVKT